MENPLENNQASSDVVPEKQPKPKKKFFTVGKIISIFAGLVLVGSVVGILYYAQSGDRLTGALKLLQLQPREEIITLETIDDAKDTGEVKTVSDFTAVKKDSAYSTVREFETKDTKEVDTLKSIVTCDADKGLTSTTDAEGNTTCVCDGSRNFVPNPAATSGTRVFTTGLVPVDPCICAIGYDFVNYGLINGECIPPDKPSDSTPTISKFDTTAKKAPADTPTITTEPTCPNNEMELIVIPGSGSFANYVPSTTKCFCPEDTYYNAKNNDCVPLSCDLTQEEIKVIIENQNEYTRPDVYTTLADFTNSSWYAENCGETTTTTTPPVCYSLSIVEPTDQDSIIITSDFNGDAMKLNVSDASAVTRYEYTSSTGAITFTGTGPEIQLSGGPAPGGEDIITVQAYGMSSGLQAAPQEFAWQKCTDTLKVVREMSPPVTYNPECRSLSIIKPNEAVGGQPTITIHKDGYESIELAIQLDDDPGAVSKFRYKSLNGTVDFNSQGTEYDTVGTSVMMDGGPAEGASDTITVWAIDADGNGIQSCHDSFNIMVDAPSVEEGPVCRSLNIVKPNDAVGGQPTVTISEDGYSSEELTISVDADSGAVSKYKYSSVNGTVDFNGQSSGYSTVATTVNMDGGPAEGGSDTVTVWAVDADGNGIQSCHDAFNITVDAPPPDDPPPPPDDPPPPPDDPPPPSDDSPPPPDDPPPPPPPVVTIVPTPEPTPQPVPQPQLHAAAPRTPDNGPGLLIMVGVAISGAIYARRKRKK